MTAASVSYLANATFGGLVAIGVIDNRRIRWVHHALFVITASLTGIALAAGAAERRPAGLALLPSVVPLSVLPYSSGTVNRHAAVAAVAAPAYAGALTLAWRQ